MSGFRSFHSLNGHPGLTQTVVDRHVRGVSAAVPEHVYQGTWSL